MIKWSKEGVPGDRPHTDYPHSESAMRYNFIFAETPLGPIFIEWKGWKITPSYDVTLFGELIAESTSTLEDAKLKTEQYLQRQADEYRKVAGVIDRFLNGNS